MDSRMIHHMGSTRVNEIQREAEQSRRARQAAGEGRPEKRSLLNWIRRRPQPEPMPTSAPAPPRDAPFSGLPAPLESDPPVVAESSVEAKPAPRIAA